MLACFANTNSNAQHVSGFEQVINKYKIAQPASRGVNKTTNTYWRLAATSSYSDMGFGLEIDDSTKYQYSNARGSEFSLEDLETDYFAIDSKIDCDTATEFSDNGSGFEASSRYIFNYDLNNVKTTLIEQSSTASKPFENDYKQEVSRDSKGNVIREYHMQWNNNAWDTTTISELSYDSQDNLLSDSTYTVPGYQPVHKNLYAYNGSGQLISEMSFYYINNNWDSSYENQYVYVNNKVAISIYRHYQNNQWYNLLWDSVGYNSNGIRNYALSKEWDTTAKQWYNSRLENRTINSNDQPTITKYATYDTSSKKWEDEVEAQFNYNTNDDVSSIVVYAYFNGTKLPSPAYLRNYYYEHYFNVNVQEVGNTVKPVVFPNPANSFINIKGAAEGIVSLINMAGQTVKQLQVNSAGQQITIPVSGLPAGNYILNFDGQDSQPYRQLVTVQ